MVPTTVGIMKPKLIQLDRRMTGHYYFKYAATFKGPEQHMNFALARNWCWELWGPTSEVDTYGDTTINTNWIWSWERVRPFSSVGRMSRIFLKGDEEANWFMLKWA